ncbi:MAG: helix-turn-helix domain-containing protein [Capsulimonadales bacterium]|nr:helix-turn-helix domain-containing protein [Capsulimonadales bacterium]
MEKLLDVSVVAQSLGVKPGRVYQMAKRRQIPFVYVGRRIYIPQRAWNRWIDETSRMPTPFVGKV